SQSPPSHCAGHSREGGHEPAALSAANTTLAFGPVLSGGLIVVGLALMAATVAGGYALGATHALAAYHIGAMACLAMTLGCMFWVMAFHLTGAGWAVTVRRQFENVMWLMPFVVAMVLPVLILEMWQDGHLF